MFYFRNGQSAKAIKLLRNKKDHFNAYNQEQNLFNCTQ